MEVSMGDAALAERLSALELKVDNMEKRLSAFRGTMLALEQRASLLETQQALTVDLIARVLSGKWKGGEDSAEALLYAISPKFAEEGFEAFPFVGR
jgi:hypothetical protein